MISPESGIQYEGEFVSENEESEDEFLRTDFRRQLQRSKVYSALDEYHRGTGQFSNMNIDSIMNEKDQNINRLRNELYDKERQKQKFKRKYIKIRKMYKKKCLEFGNFLLK